MITTSVIWLFASVLLWTCSVSFFSFWRGYKLGVKETEQRWSDAVDYARKHDHTHL